MFRYAPMAGESVTSFIIVRKFPKASFASALWYEGIACPLMACVETTNISDIANATRCRNWSGPVIATVHLSDSAHGVGLFGQAGGNGLFGIWASGDVG